MASPRNLIGFSAREEISPFHRIAQPAAMNDFATCVEVAEKAEFASSYAAERESRAPQCNQGKSNAKQRVYHITC
jgi:hypothetical protein